MDCQYLFTMRSNRGLHFYQLFTRPMCRVMQMTVQLTIFEELNNSLDFWNRFVWKKALTLKQLLLLVTSVALSNVQK